MAARANKSISIINPYREAALRATTNIRRVMASY
jgi:hypothetical protein